MPDTSVVTLRVVTSAPEPCRGFATGCVCAACKAQIKLIAAQRSRCPACHGDAAKCMEGTAEPDFDRLPGCRAFIGEGKLRPLPAQRAPRQPWDVRPARNAA